jgi:hypothetical protein
MGNTAALLPTWPNATCDWIEMTECVFKMLRFPLGTHSMHEKPVHVFAPTLSCDDSHFIIGAGVENACRP